MLYDLNQPVAPTRTRGGVSLHQLTWMKTALEVFVLLLALPWLLHELFTHPGRLTRHAASHHLK